MCAKIEGRYPVEVEAAKLCPQFIMF